MKIYMSTDIEGVTGITDWKETDSSQSDYAYFARQMTQEVRAACLGANKAGANEIWINDAHDQGRNINMEQLPENIKIIRGWSGDPYFMMQSIDRTFQAVLFIGYHSPAGSNENPLSHSLSLRLFSIKLNDRLASEFLINSYIAAYYQVPVVFLSGDQGVCHEAAWLNPGIETLAVNQGNGESVESIHPQLALKKITQKVESVLKKDLTAFQIKLPAHFTVELSFIKHFHAYRAAFYPGMEKKDPHTVIYRTDDFFEVLRMLMFVI